MRPLSKGDIKYSKWKGAKSYKISPQQIIVLEICPKKMTLPLVNKFQKLSDSFAASYCKISIIPNRNYICDSWIWWVYIFRVPFFYRRPDGLYESAPLLLLHGRNHLLNRPIDLEKKSSRVSRILQGGSKANKTKFNPPFRRSNR